MLFLCGLQNLQYWIEDGPKLSFCLRFVVLINTLCSVFMTVFMTFTRVNLRGWGGYWDMLWGQGGDVDRVGMETEAVGMGFSFCSRADL